MSSFGVAYGQSPESVTSAEIGVSTAQQADQQSPGSISGTVLDESGAVVVGAQVTVTEESQAEPPEKAGRSVISGENGEFAFPNLPPGAFQIKVAASGFGTQTISGTLHSGEVYLTPTVTLQLAKQSTEVVVTATAAEIALADFKAETQQRVLGVVPNFYVSYVPDAPPLTSKQKWELAWRSTIDPVTWGLTAIVAGAGQVQNEFSGYGQGAAGYAKRFGAVYTDNLTSTFIGGALLPVLFKQDPRYFYKGTGSVRSRMLYAIANAVICKGDNGHWEPNYSAILGGFASGGISNMYYPPQDRGTALVFINTAIGTGETAILNVFQEFVVKKFTPHTP